MRSQRPPWLEQALHVVHARASCAVSLRAVAQCAGVHPNSLARAFREHLGSSLGEYVRKLRIDEAAEKLLRTPLSIADIAIETGFADQSHLTRLFHRATGMTPAQYRERFRDERRAVTP